MGFPIQKPESVLEDETNKILWNFEIQMDHLIPATWPDLVLIHKTKKDNLSSSGFYCSCWSENKRKTIKKYLELGWELKRTMKHENDGDTNCGGYTWNGPQVLEKEAEGIGDQGRIETIQITAVLRSARILKRILETWSD